MVAAHGYESVTVTLYKYRPDSVQSLGVLLLHDIEQEQKISYIGNALWLVTQEISAFGGAKSTFPPFSEVFKKNRNEDKRTAEEIMTGLAKKLKRLKKR